VGRSLQLEEPAEAVIILKPSTAKLCVLNVAEHHLILMSVPAITKLKQFQKELFVVSAVKVVVSQFLVVAVII